MLKSGDYFPPVTRLSQEWIHFIHYFPKVVVTNLATRRHCFLNDQTIINLCDFTMLK